MKNYSTWFVSQCALIDYAGNLIASRDWLKTTSAQNLYLSQDLSEMVLHIDLQVWVKNVCY